MEEHVVAVHPHCSGTDFIGHANNSLVVVRMNCSRETVHGIIRTLNHLVNRLKLESHNNRAKDFFSSNAHVIGYVFENGGRDEVAFRAEFDGSLVALCTGSEAVLDVIPNAVILDLVNKWAVP